MYVDTAIVFLKVVAVCTCVYVAVCLCVRLLHLCFFFGSIGPTWLHQSKSISYLLVTPASSC